MPVKGLANQMTPFQPTGAQLDPSLVRFPPGIRSPLGLIPMLARIYLASSDLKKHTSRLLIRKRSLHEMRWYPMTHLIAAPGAISPLSA